MKTPDCNRCRESQTLDLEITMAFQPILNVADRHAHAYEALVRGANGEGAGTVLSQVSEATRYSFDQQCRTSAIRTASGLGLKDHEHAPLLSINFLPNAVYEPRACIRQTLAVAMETGFPLNRIMFEFTENERLDTDHLLNILRTYRSMGFLTAIDDFGAGYSGLNLLAAFQPDFIKLDMDLIRNVDRDRAKQVIVDNVLTMARDLGVTPICEGVETAAECETLGDMGVSLMQGYFFARPEIEALPAASWSGDAARASAAG
ncbi:MAG: EAL domain-containing protein [Henriciella sp.]|uniref:EAL domain-containing protein n=1 Tax=Henriciella sp. TaxID=1968823 RepID=UPI003C71E9C2